MSRKMIDIETKLIRLLEDGKIDELEYVRNLIPAERIAYREYCKEKGLVEDVESAKAYLQYREDSLSEYIQSLPPKFPED